MCSKYLLVVYDISQKMNLLEIVGMQFIIQKVKFPP